jgi:hypothetical protein
MTLGPSAARCAGSGWTIGGNPRSRSRSHRLPTRGSTRKKIGGFTLSDLVDRVVEAMKATELDCAGWHPDSLRKLARAAVEVVRVHELAKLELAGCCLPPEPKAAAIRNEIAIS